MGIQEWSAIDINKARSYFLKGLPIKDIAKELGRSTTATNKALSRFGIRFSRPKRNLMESAQLKEKNQFQFVPPSFERSALKLEFENWISFWQLCEYLKNQNVCIYELSSSNIELEHRQFRVGTKILSSKQLVLLANKIRTENNMKAFFVKGVSW